MNKTATVRVRKGVHDWLKELSTHLFDNLIWRTDHLFRAHGELNGVDGRILLKPMCHIGNIAKISGTLQAQKNRVFCDLVKNYEQPLIIIDELGMIASVSKPYQKLLDPIIVRGEHPYFDYHTFTLKSIDHSADEISNPLIIKPQKTSIKIQENEILGSSLKMKSLNLDQSKRWIRNSINREVFEVVIDSHEKALMMKEHLNKEKGYRDEVLKKLVRYGSVYAKANHGITVRMGKNRLISNKPVVIDIYNTNKVNGARMRYFFETPKHVDEIDYYRSAIHRMVLDLVRPQIKEEVFKKRLRMSSQ